MRQLQGVSLHLNCNHCGLWQLFDGLTWSRVPALSLTSRGRFWSRVLACCVLNKVFFWSWSTYLSSELSAAIQHCVYVWLSLVTDEDVHIAWPWQAASCLPGAEPGPVWARSGRWPPSPSRGAEPSAPTTSRSCPAIRWELPMAQSSNRNTMAIIGAA